MLICIGLFTTTQGQAKWASENELKSAFVYNLLPFIDWPEGALGDRLVIGVAGDGPMAAVLSKFLEEKRIGARPIEVRIVRTGAELRACNVVLLSYSDSTRTQAAIAQIQQTTVVSVGDGREFARVGGMIAFVPNGNTFQLAINPHAADRARVKISAKVLNMAELLTDDSGSGNSKP